MKLPIYSLLSLALCSLILIPFDCNVAAAQQQVSPSVKMTGKVWTSSDTTVTMRYADYRRLLQISQQLGTANDAQQLLMKLDLNGIVRRVKVQVDTTKQPK